MTPCSQILRSRPPPPSHSSLSFSHDPNPRSLQYLTHPSELRGFSHHRGSSDLAIACVHFVTIQAALRRQKPTMKANVSICVETALQRLFSTSKRLLFADLYQYAERCLLLNRSDLHLLKHLNSIETPLHFHYTLKLLKKGFLISISFLWAQKTVWL